MRTERTETRAHCLVVRLYVFPLLRHYCLLRPPCVCVCVCGSLRTEASPGSFISPLRCLLCRVFALYGRTYSKPREIVFCSDVNIGISGIAGVARNGTNHYSKFGVHVRVYIYHDTQSLFGTNKAINISLQWQNHDLSSFLARFNEAITIDARLKI